MAAAPSRQNDARPRTNGVAGHLLLALGLSALALAGCAGPAGDGRQPSSTSPSSSSPLPPPAGAPTGETPPEPAGPPQPAVGLDFGLDIDSLALQQAAGLQPDYTTLWIGPWNLQRGWRVPDAHLATLRALDITPAIHFYYWGDDLAPGCLTQGCNGKSRQDWDRLAAQLVDRLNATMQGEPVLIVLETEFNKGSVARHEPLDELLAAKANDLRAGYPAARIALGFGGWNPAAWPTWDRAVAASDAVGLQALTGSTNAHATAASLYNDTLAGAQRLSELFGKPVLIDDLAVPSAPDPASRDTQNATLGPFLAGLRQLKEAGVEALLYRSFTDNPGVPLTHYFGEAERHFGLAEAATGALKPAGEAWAQAMRAERDAPATNEPGFLKST